MSGLRILVSDFSGHPFQAQLSRELARRGATVHHAHCGSYVTGKGAVEARPDDPPTLTFESVDLPTTFAKHSVGTRFRQERRYGDLLVEATGRFRPDVILSANMPLFAQARIQGYAHRHGIRFVFWLQDITSIAMSAELRRRMPVVGSVGGSYLGRVERRLLRDSDAIVVISDDFRPRLASWKVEPSRVVVVENWAPLDELPVRPRSNEWSRRHDLEGRFVFLYAGTLGLKHDPELLVQLAKHLRPHPDARVVIVSEGAGADLCRRRAGDEALDNLLVLPFQPYADLPDVLATSDVAVVMLEREAGVFSVPSKVLSYHCAGRPLLAAVPAENLAARLIERNGSGIVVAPGDHQAAIAAAIRLMTDDALRAECAANARAYAESAFDIGAIADRFTEVMASPVTAPADLRAYDFA